MARDFTAQEARNLIDRYQRLVEQVDDVASSGERYKADTGTYANALLNSKWLADTVRKGLLDGKKVTADHDTFYQFISSIYKHMFSAPVISECVENFTQLDTVCAAAVSNLTHGTKSGLQWFFTSGSNKQAAGKAYIQLKNALQSQTYQNTIELVQQAHEIEDEPYDVVLADFEQNKSTYRTNLFSLVPGIQNKGSILPEVDSLAKRNREVKDQLYNIYASEGATTDAILAAVNNYLLQEALQLLGSISVDELSKVKSGLRVRALQENGFETLYDIFSATTSTLSFVKGISWDTAFQIKDYVNDYLERARSSVKIRLSVDNRTPQASQLVLALFQHRQKHAYIGKARELRDIFQQHNESNDKNLGYIGNGINWLFFNEHQTDFLRKSYKSFAEFLDKYEPVARELIRDFGKIDAKLPSEAWKDFQENSYEYYNILEKLVPELLGNSDNIYGLPEDLAREIQEQDFFPDGLNCKLRRYQEWGVKYILHQERVLLGDEMGLGKTVQAIATMVSLRNTGATHFMIVCPASVLPNWCKEITQKSKLRSIKIHGSEKRSALKEWIRTGGAAVTTYETVGSLELTETFRFSLLIVDEAHYIKHDTAKRTVNVRALSNHADRMLFMTGTALENEVSEMISLIKMLQPVVAMEAEPLSFMATAPQFREKVIPVYYRRKRSDVLTELPDKIETQEWCTLSGQEEQIYENAVFSKARAEIRRVSWNVDDLSLSCKARRMMELIGDAKEDGRKILIFSFFLDTLRKIADYLGDACQGVITGSVPVQRRQDIINDFEKAPAGSCLLAQIYAGGTGLNIQSASVVIICEPQFKPSIENQAISRAYRMGQTRKVLVYRLLCEDSVDERLTDRLAIKQAKFDAFADKSVAADITKQEEAAIDDKTFGKIIEEEIERIKEKHASAESIKR